MTPLDHYKNVAHDLLGFPVPGIPDIPQPTYKTTLPPFIQKLPSLADEDADYLKAKGVFSLPDERLQNELLRTFVLHVHPYLPVLDLPPFLQAIADNNGHSAVSLLLMYAVMFSAIAFVDPTHIQRAGYTSRKAARQEFFRKARVSPIAVSHLTILTIYQVLYDFDVERDRIVLIQTVLLMTYWHENQDDPKDFRHWLEIALSQAALAMPIKEQEQRTRASTFTSPGLWKRLWWCMYTRDRLNALNLRRSPVIKDAEFTVPLPTLSDFDIGPYPPSVLAMPVLGACEVLRSPTQQQHLAAMFIEKAKLCTTISGIIFPITNAAVFAPAVFTHYIAALDEWHTSLPKEVQYHSPPEQTAALSEGERALFAYRAWLEMIYLAASGALHRQNQAQSQNEKSLQSGGGGDSTTNPSGDDIHSVTQSIAGVADGLNQLDLVHCLPTTTVGLLTPVLATHFMNIRSETPDLWRNAFQSLYQCLKVLEKLGEVYELAESMAGFFQAAICGDANVGTDMSTAESSREARETAFLQRTLTAEELEGFARLVGGRAGLQKL